MVNGVVIIGLVFNLIASFLIAYGRIFRSKETIKNESKTKGKHNLLKRSIDLRKQGLLK